MLRWLWRKWYLIEKNHNSHLVDNRLFTYRNPSQETTNRSPAELFLNRKSKTLITLLKTNLSGVIEGKKQEKQNMKTQFFSYVPEDNVWMRWRREMDTGENFGEYDIHRRNSRNAKIRSHWSFKTSPGCLYRSRDHYVCT